MRSGLVLVILVGLSAAVSLPEYRGDDVELLSALRRNMIFELRRCMETKYYTQLAFDVFSRCCPGGADDSLTPPCPYNMSDIVYFDGSFTRLEQRRLIHGEVISDEEQRVETSTLWTPIDAEIKETMARDRDRIEAYRNGTRGRVAAVVYNNAGPFFVAIVFLFGMIVSGISTTPEQRGPVPSEVRSDSMATQADIFSHKQNKPALTPPPLSKDGRRRRK